jgi:hypothetical protein
LTFYAVLEYAWATKKVFSGGVDSTPHFLLVSGNFTDILFANLKFILAKVVSLRSFTLCCAKESSPMPTYIVLYKLTDQGIKNIEEAPQRIEEAIKAIEAAGAK